MKKQLLGLVKNCAMKKIILAVFALVFTAGHLLAQGQFTFQANAANGLIQYSTDDSAIALYPLNPGLPLRGNAHVGFYTAPNGTLLTLGVGGMPDFTGWTANTLVLNVGTGPGKTPGAIVTIPFAANNVNVELEVVAWSGTATSWSQAVGNLSPTSLLTWSGKVFPGTGNPSGAFGWSQPTGDPTLPIPNIPAILVTGPSGYNGLILAVPEPSALALIGVGAMAMVTGVLRKRARRS